MVEIIKANSGKRRLKLACLSYIMKDGRIREGTSCEFPVKVGSHGEVNGLKFWNWDGNEANPTISPSISCQICGLHVVITKGAETGRPQAYAMRNYSKNGMVYDEDGNVI